MKSYKLELGKESVKSWLTFKVCSRARDSVSHTLMVLSADAVANLLLSGLKLTE